MASKAGIGIALQEAGKGLMQYTQYNIEEMRQKNLDAIRQRERGEDIAWREKEAASEETRFNTQLGWEKTKDRYKALDDRFAQAGSEFSGALSKMQARKADLEAMALDPEKRSDPAAMADIKAQLSNLEKEESRILRTIDARKLKVLMTSDPEWLKDRGYRLEDFDVEEVDVPEETGGKAFPSKEVLLRPETRQLAADQANKFLQNNKGATFADAVKYLEGSFGPSARSLIVEVPKAAAGAPAGSLAAPASTPTSAVEKKQKSVLDSPGVVLDPGKQLGKSIGVGVESAVSTAGENLSGRVSEAKAFKEISKIGYQKSNMASAKASAAQIAAEIKAAGGVVTDTQLLGLAVGGVSKTDKGVIRWSTGLTTDEMRAAGIPEPVVEKAILYRAELEQKDIERRSPASPKKEAQKKSDSPVAASRQTAKNAIDVNAIVSGAAKDAGIEEHSGVMMRMAAAETGGEKDRSSAVSPKGAIGLLQLKPGSSGAIAQLKKMGVIGDDFNPKDPAQNARAAAHYFKYLLGQFSGNVRAAVAAYNGGEGLVAKAMKDSPGSWERLLPRETRGYMKKVLS